MITDFDMSQDSKITCSVIFGLGIIASIWISIFSPHILDWMGVDLNKKVVGRDWAKRFILCLVFQPVTFGASAIGLWWYPLLFIIPPLPFLLRLICLVAIDFVRPDEMWEKGYQRLF